MWSVSFQVACTPKVLVGQCSLWCVHQLSCLKRRNMELIRLLYTEVALGAATGIFR